MEVAGIGKMAHKCKTLGKRQMQRGQGEEKDEWATAGPGYLSMKDGRRAGSQNNSRGLAEVGRHLWRSLLQALLQQAQMEQAAQGPSASGLCCPGCCGLDLLPSSTPRLPSAWSELPCFTPPPPTAIFMLLCFFTRDFQ